MADDRTMAADEGVVDEDEIERRWDAAPEDPDLNEDLGYELEPLDVLVTSNSDKKLMMLPRCDEMIREDAYIIADFDLGCDPVERA